MLGLETRSRLETGFRGLGTIQYNNAVLSYTPYVAYSQTIRRRGLGLGLECSGLGRGLEQ